MISKGLNIILIGIILFLLLCNKKSPSGETPPQKEKIISTKDNNTTLVLLPYEEYKKKIKDSLSVKIITKYKDTIIYRDTGRVDTVRITMKDSTKYIKAFRHMRWYEDDSITGSIITLTDGNIYDQTLNYTLKTKSKLKKINIFGGVEIGYNILSPTLMYKKKNRITGLSYNLITKQPSITLMIKIK